MATNNKKTIKYSAEGIVLGYLWDNSEGSYISQNIEADTKKELLKKANEMLEDGSLQKGSNLQRNLKGAYLVIKKTVTMNVDGFDYERKEFTDAYIGKLTTEEKIFLYECAVAI